MRETQNSLHFQRPTSPIVTLRRKWWLATLLHCLILGWAYLELPALWHQQGLAWRWFLLTALAMAYLLWQLYRSLANNHRQGETTVLPTFGLGSHLTLLRGLATGLMTGLLFLPYPTGTFFAWAPGLLYTANIILDYLDGYAARATNHATKLGEMLDRVYDTLAILVAVGLTVWYGLLPIWYLLVGAASYLFDLGLWWRRRHDRPTFDLTPSWRRRLLAGFQMTFISLLLWPLNYPPGAVLLIGLFSAGPLLAGFWRDWLVVSGRLDPASARYIAFRSRLTGFLDNWLPPVLRAGVVLLVLLYLFPLILSDVGRQTLFPWPGSPLLTSGANLLLISLTTLMLALGALTRAAALGLLIPTLLTISAVNLTPANGLLLVGVVLMILLGGGKWSLWRRDDSWVSVRAGEAE